MISEIRPTERKVRLSSVSGVDFFQADNDAQTSRGVRKGRPGKRCLIRVAEKNMPIRLQAIEIEE
jgi:hypothetical protein